MALIDIIGWDGGGSQLAWKWPSTNLRFGSQLVVRPGQTAFFVYKGRICDEIKEGTITLKTGNIPFLTMLMSLPFGLETPFQAEVFFVSTLAKLNLKWGTATPINIEDSKYGLIFPVRAYGQYSIRVNDPKLFLASIVGASQSISSEIISQYFRGKIISAASKALGDIFNSNISFTAVATHLDELSLDLTQRISPFLEQYGIIIDSFFVESINLPENDTSFIKLKQIKERSAEISILGKDIYKFDRNIDVLRAVAENTASGGGALQSAFGAGIGLAIGSTVATQFQQSQNVTHTGEPPSSPGSQTSFFVAVEGTKVGPLPIDDISRMVVAGSLGFNTLVWKPGYSNWIPARQDPEISRLIASLSSPDIPR